MSARRKRRQPSRELRDEPSRVAGEGGREARPARARAAEETKHQFQVGERVRMTGGGSSWARSESLCQIVALLPHERGPLLYRVQSDAESYQRVVEETDLSSLR